jgi:bifunctional DNA-binding transcriptional regulator/antitoxin component of YhaV-PrlF toxin-antitoxin module
MPSNQITVTLKDKTQLVVPPRIQRLAGIKIGDRVEFKVSARTITIQPVERTYKPTRAEWAAIRKGEAAIARGDSVSLTEFLNVDSNGRKTRPKGSRKVSS